MIVGLILAGGRSSRMGGGDKSLLKLAGRPLLAHVIERFSPQVERLAINANGPPERFGLFALPVIPDAFAGYQGPLAGVQAGLDWAAGIQTASHLATVAADTPFFPLDLVARMVAAAADPSRIVVARSSGKAHPVFGLWPLQAGAALRAHLQGSSDRTVMAFAERYGLDCVDFPAGTADPFFNINTPQDLEMAEATWEGKKP